ncbi:Gcd10p family-domain-containing protein [Xylogone sp. PMI_703]|nr:Gcd10p family-domain-containing protein [Xylogone sp. PMI_703]
MHSLINPGDWVVFRLPSTSLRLVQAVPNTTISLPKFGSFPSNLLIGRPYYFTYELLDRKEGQKASGLRVVPASELHVDTIAEEKAASSPSGDDGFTIGEDGVEFQLVGEDGEVLMRSNRETIDDNARQTLTYEEIETLKREGTDAGKELIAKLMLSHTGIEEKTAFSLAKYKLLKTKKYLRQFSVLPLDVPMLAHWAINEKESNKILELREETLALLGCWANAHFAEDYRSSVATDSVCEPNGGRWLAVDETGGLLVAAMAERMGVLYSEPGDEVPAKRRLSTTNADQLPENSTEDTQSISHPHPKEDVPVPYAPSNTITLVHTNAQPNLSLLRYFNYFVDDPTPHHPLARHLLPISWLQLVNPSLDLTYSSEPPYQTPAELHALKSGKRGAYYRKRRRWVRTKYIADTTRQGQFSGLAVASSMDPVSILRHTLPLLRDGAPVAVYSPTIEPLTALTDLYSTSRRTAFIQSPPSELDGFTQEISFWQGNEDFPLNPTLLLNPTVQTSRARQWQVLPGRTHPLMTSRGGAEGYLFTATKVRPAEGKVEARGKYNRKKEGEPAVKTERQGATGGTVKNNQESGDSKRRKTETEDDVADTIDNDTTMEIES